MAFVLGLAQCCHPDGSGTEAVLEMAEQWCAEASLCGVDILVFPESLMTRYELNKQSFASEAEPIAGRSAAAWMPLRRVMVFGLCTP